MRRTIIVTGARAPSALHLARVFHCAGHRVILADTFRYPMSRATRMKDSYVRLPSPRQGFSGYAAAVADLVARESPDLIVPTCEEVFYLAAVRDRRGIDMPLFAPDFDELIAFHFTRYEFGEVFAIDGKRLPAGNSCLIGGGDEERLEAPQFFFKQPRCGRRLIGL